MLHVVHRDVGAADPDRAGGARHRGDDALAHAQAGTLLDGFRKFPHQVTSVSLAVALMVELESRGTVTTSSM